MMFEATRLPGFRASLNFLVSVCIVGLLVATGVFYYAGAPVTAGLMNFTGAFYPARTEVMLHLAHHGTFPENDAALSGSSLPEEDRASGRALLKRRIRNGAITVLFENRSYGPLKGKKLTLRPVVPLDDPAGPVCWVTTKKVNLPGRRLHGEDETDIDQAYLPGELDLNPLP